ncbi:alpha N-terminal protein methyltransferase 1 [Dorcoceras hygrometricum]|uniref:Alpha N-terminal protein methyltransferase 1 n=1 Tax=Dorcoceras hygrometricum TaxID=472368 RepID=A0A2Z7BQ71_9LAMI|nr:alpha N-terminal protein methyltransferase 1 [Dorcoceras hygrometricum]
MSTVSREPFSFCAFAFYWFLKPDSPQTKNPLTLKKKPSDQSTSLTSPQSQLVRPIHLKFSRRLLHVRVAFNMDSGGIDSDGREFKNAEEMWREEVGEADPMKKSQWYSQGIAYWQGVEATVDGVMGGYENINVADIEASEAFLNTLLSERFPDAGRGQKLVALDCGSGIGRISKNLLIRYFNEVDLLEPVPHFLDAARTNLAPENLMVMENRAVNFFGVPLQWCIGHLSDDDFVSFFKRALVGLKTGGLFVLKENIARSGFVLDKEDKSVTRSHLYFKQLFKQCGLNVYKMKNQKGLPDGLFAVKMYALSAESPQRVGITRSAKMKLIRPGIIID